MAQNTSWSDYLPRPAEDKEGWRLHCKWLTDVQSVDSGWKKCILISSNSCFKERCGGYIKK